MKKLWGARFKKELNDLAKSFSYSLRVDHALLSAEIKASMAHAAMLGKVGLISPAESKQLIRGLWQVLASLKREPLERYAHEVEDIHTLIQSTLEKKIGSVARKLHTARSRNDLVATSAKIYVKEKIPALIEKINQFQEALTGLAEKNQTVLIPAYTHLQRAQIVSVAHHLLAYVEMLARDQERLRDLGQHLNTCPLGSGAVAGSGFDLDRKYVAQLLGFQKASRNSMDAVSDRDFVVETLSVLAILMMHLSRLAEDLILWNSSEFGFITLADEYATGSSLMPHKKNPDMLELTRGKAASVFGGLVSVLAMMKGLPLAYNRDMQEDKKPLFEAIAVAEGSLSVLSGFVETLRVNRDACARAINDSFLYATDLLEYLVRRKVAFRDAHDIVGKLVQYALESNLNLSGMALEIYQKFSPKFKKDVFELFHPNVSVTSKRTLGSTNPKLVKAEVERWKKELRKEKAVLRRARVHHA